MDAQLAACGWTFERFPAIVPTAADCQGFFNSAMVSNWLGYMAEIERGVEWPLLILEDDVSILDPQRVESRVDEWLNGSADMLYLYGAQSMQRIYGVHQSHAFMVRPSSVPAILARMAWELDAIHAGRVPRTRTLAGTFFGWTIQRDFQVIGTEPLIVQDRARWGSDTGWGWQGKK